MDSKSHVRLCDRGERGAISSCSNGMQVGNDKKAKGLNDNGKSEASELPED